MDRKPDQSPLAELWALVAGIPRGRCASYGALGRGLRNPASGYLVGRWMAQCPQGLPWWRVVAKDGRLPIHKRDPRWAQEQCERLEQEGIGFIEGRVNMEAHGWEPELGPGL